MRIPSMIHDDSYVNLLVMSLSLAKVPLSRSSLNWMVSIQRRPCLRSTGLGNDIPAKWIGFLGKIGRNHGLSYDIWGFL